MKVNTASNILKILLIIFTIGVIFLGLYALPALAEEMLNIYPELEDAKLPILIICELLLVVLLLGIWNMVYLIILFDRDLTFSLKFTRGLETLVGMCILASIGTVFLYIFTLSIGAPGTLSSLIMIGMIFVILIIAMVIMLIRAIVKKTMFYKNDYDLTV